MDEFLMQALVEQFAKAVRNEQLARRKRNWTGRRYWMGYREAVKETLRIIDETAVAEVVRRAGELVLNERGNE